jgi:hypothetical protein
MSWPGWIKHAVAAVAVAGLAALSAVVDHLWPRFATGWPVTANVVAGALWTPAEFYLATVLVTQWLQARERRRWRSVAAELTAAIGGTWDSLRDLLVYQYSLDDLVSVHAHITAAEHAWQDLRRQDEQQPDDVAGSSDAQWDIPVHSSQAIGQMSGVWLLMWPAGLARDLHALQRKLTRVLLPRMGEDDPDLASAGRLLIDALGDLGDLAGDLSEGRADPFPETPFTDPADNDPDERPVIARGAPEGALRDLADLRQAFALAGQVVECGDRLMALISRQQPSRRRSVRRNGNTDDAGVPTSVTEDTGSE